MSEMFPNLSFLMGAKMAADTKAAAEELRHVQTYGDTNWNKNNTSLDGYGANIRFADADLTLRQLIEERRRENGVVLDLAGGTDAVAARELLDSGVVAQALVTNLEDRCSDEVRADTRVHHVKGDLLVPDTWKKILEWRQTAATDGFDIELHRPFRILQHLNPEIYDGAANLLIDNLRPGGVFFSQVPSSLKKKTRGTICRDIESRQDVAAVLTAFSFRYPHRHIAVLKKAS